MADLSLSDILALVGQQHAASNTLPSVGDSILGVKLQAPYGTSPWESLGVSVLQGLLGGGLKGYGAGQEQAFQQELTKQLISGQPLTANDILDSSSVDATNNYLALLGMQKQQAMQAKLADIGLKGLEAQVVKRNELTGELAGAQDFMKLGSASDSGTASDITRKPGDNPLADIKPGSPLALTDFGAKVIDQNMKASDQKHQFSKDNVSIIQNALNAIQKDDPYGQAYVQMGPAFKSLIELAPAAPSKSADVTFFATLGRILDPVGAIGRGAEENAQNAITMYQKAFGDLGDVLGQGGGMLTPKARLDIIKNISTRVSPLGEGYNAAIERQKGLLGAQGIDITPLNSIPKYQPFDFASATKSVALQEFNRLMAEPGADKAAVAKQILDKYGDIP